MTPHKKPGTIGYIRWLAVLAPLPAIGEWQNGHHSEKHFKGAVGAALPTPKKYGVP
jgi:hypothetical protein